jgi:nanoRNase/pAp phosphatase (c-di-AMP/oligoRNAs hydrolase)
MGKIHIFTDADLDGAGCVFLLRQAFPASEISYKVTTEKNFRQDILNWQLTDSFKNYDKVFVCDLNIKDETSLVDVENVIVFDHHKDHVEVKHEYVKAKPVVEDYTSCTRLIYDKLKLKSKLINYQNLLVKLIDDYDSYTLSIPHSRQLNHIFWNYTGDRVAKFLTDFGAGFNGFNTYHKNTLKLVESRLENYFKTEKLYMNDVELNGTKYKLIGGFFSFSPNEICERALKDNDADICMLMSTKNKTVVFRRSSKCTLSMRKLASSLSDGGGHDDAAGATLNNSIINLTKLLKEIGNE